MAILDTLSALPPPSQRVCLLSRFDPALRDRARAERLFGFYYRIEIFVPARRRRYGYYVFSVMQGDRLKRRLDAKRDAGVLMVRAFWPEVGARMGRARQTGLLAELQRVLMLAEMTEVRFAPGWLRA